MPYVEDPDLGALTEKSIQQGINYLREHMGSIVVFNVDGKPTNREAKELEAELNRGIGHSGYSFTVALKQVFARAKAELHGEIQYQDKKGHVCPVDPGSKQIPAKTARIALKL